jgi:hypothetical protein
MNNDFDNLMYEAGLTAQGCWDEMDDYDHAAIMKFAKLIVRECVKVMYDNAIERKVPPDINQTPTHYAIAVLEHFGVEE